MPILKHHRSEPPRSKVLEAKVARNGFRIASFGATIKEKYTGNFINDMKHGNGVQTYADGTLYEGEWRYNKRSGKGVLSTECGQGIRTRTYTGDWLYDVPHGLGVKNFPDGGMYKGQFKCGYREGSGCMQYANRYIYIGDWVKDMRSGTGKYINSQSGNYYEGEFKNDVKSGRGRFYHVLTGQVQDGVWENDRAIVTMMWDDKKHHDSAKEPTMYPIPVTQLKDPHDIFTNAAFEVLERQEKKKKTKKCP